MLEILGRADLLPTEPAARDRVEQWMDWQAAELNTAWRPAFMGRVRKRPAFADPALIEASVMAWTRHMTLLDEMLRGSSAFVAGSGLTLADGVLGLATQRWFMTPMVRPDLPALAAYFDRLDTRPGFRVHGRNGMP
jgi:glutathione S-transferase